jgi:Xaa-Pro aminopeptidase
MAMSGSVQTLPARPVANATPSSPDLGPDRRADVDAKQLRVAALLQDVGCEGLLVLEPENFGWLSSGGAIRGVLDPAQMPALYFGPEGRWVLSSNVDSQRLFDEELDGLGFQLKEWPWHWGREQLLADLCQGRTVACDQALGACKPVGDRLRLLRRTLTAYEQACCRTLGGIVGHALEATCRHLNQGETEREVAAQLSHRLVHRGVQPVWVGAAADGRSRRYRQYGYTAAPLRGSCVVTATGRKYGLCVTASRSVSFGAPEADFRQEHNAVCRVSATYLASTWPDAVPREILTTGRRVYLLSNAEHEWQLCPQGHVTGWAPVEMALAPKTETLFQAGWAVTWNPTVGAASSCDTFLVTEQGPAAMTPPENWPLKRIRVQGAEFFRPDILQR